MHILTPREIQRVLEAIHMVEQLPVGQQRQLTEATREIRYFFDGRVRSAFGATRHYLAIRCLNDPERTDISDRLGPSSQLAGEEFFGLNRFMANFPDIADVQWWAVYENGSWTLEMGNPQGEHLDTGTNGWGDLVGSVLKVNGRTLNPDEVIAFYRTIRLREERGFSRANPLFSPSYLEDILRKLNAGRVTPEISKEQLETLYDLGLVNADSTALTYVGESAITPVTAIERKQRQLTERDPGVRQIITPTLF